MYGLDGFFNGSDDKVRVQRITHRPADIWPGIERLNVHLPHIGAHLFSANLRPFVIQFFCDSVAAPGCFMIVNFVKDSWHVFHKLGSPAADELWADTILTGNFIQVLLQGGHLNE